MPVIHRSTYPGPPRYLFNGHLQTVIPSVFRKIKGVAYERERLTLSDGDFVDLDWLDTGSKKLVEMCIRDRAKHPSTQITLVYSNKSVESTIFYHQLTALQAAHPTQLKVIFLWGNAKNLRWARLNGTLSVSYTHLDVYKRQTWVGTARN